MATDPDIVQWRFGAQVSAALDAALDDYGEPAEVVARLAGITPKHLSRIRRGRALGSPEVLTDIATALGMEWRVVLQSRAAPRRYVLPHDLSADIVTRLREAHAQCPFEWEPYLDAADTIEALRSRVAAQDAELTRLRGLVGRLADGLDARFDCQSCEVEFCTPCRMTSRLLAEARAEVPR